MDPLTVVESKDIVAKEKIDFEDKKLTEMTLFEHAKILEELKGIIEDNPEMTDEESEIFERINMSVEQKILAWGYVISRIQDAQKLIDFENEFYKQKIKENEARKEVLQNRINNRSKFLHDMMNKIGKKKIEGPNFTVMLKKEVQKVEFWKDFEEIDHKSYEGLFKHIPETYQPDKRAIKEWLKTNTSEDFGLSKESYKLEVK